MLRNIALLFVLMNVSLQLFCQGDTTLFYRLTLKDKANNSHTIDKPADFLSEKAIARRERYNIPVCENDLPLTSTYIDSLTNAGYSIRTKSKWFNSVVVELNDSNLIALLDSFSFIKDKKLVYRKMFKKNIYDKFKDELMNDDLFDYGIAASQIEIHNGDTLHDMGHKGEGMLVAVIDAGYTGVDAFSVFDSLNANNQIIATKDFYKPNTGVYNDHYHGMHVLSVMASNSPGKIVGVAPKANYLLLRSEVGEDNFEYPVEEDFWCAAAEFADSLGADIITSSLGYSKFLDPNMSHTYKDMDGNTTMITNAADMAAKKGMLVVTSAGNEGNDPWYYITAPADADSVVAVGAVDENGVIADFSSRGPSCDERIKPDVVAIGKRAATVNTSGITTTGNGTSYSAPIIAGLAACLWQGFPEMSNMDIIESLIRSAHIYFNPDNTFGYGIPDFFQAYKFLDFKKNRQLYSANYAVYPNPFTKHLNIDFFVFQDNKIHIALYNLRGNKVLEETVAIPYIGYTHTIHVGEDFPSGIYFLKISYKNKVEEIKLIKLKVK